MSAGINWGSANIQSIYIGDQPIAEVYYGSVLVFGGMAQVDWLWEDNFDWTGYLDADNPSGKRYDSNRAWPYSGNGVHYVNNSNSRTSVVWPQVAPKTNKQVVEMTIKVNANEANSFQIIGFSKARNAAHNALPSDSFFGLRFYQGEVTLRFHSTGGTSGVSMSSHLDRSIQTGQTWRLEVEGDLVKVFKDGVLWQSLTMKDSGADDWGGHPPSAYWPSGEFLWQPMIIAQGNNSMGGTVLDSYRYGEVKKILPAGFSWLWEDRFNWTGFLDDTNPSGKRYDSNGSWPYSSSSRGHHYVNNRSSKTSVVWPQVDPQGGKQVVESEVQLASSTGARFTTIGFTKTRTAAHNAAPSVAWFGLWFANGVARLVIRPNGGVISVSGTGYTYELPSVHQNVVTGDVWRLEVDGTVCEVYKNDSPVYTVDLASGGVNDSFPVANWFRFDNLWQPVLSVTGYTSQVGIFARTFNYGEFEIDHDNGGDDGD